MATKYEIFFTELAEIQIIKIYDYISTNCANKKAADDLMASIDDALLYTEKDPYIYPMSKKEGFRKCRVNKYIAIYKIVESKKQVWVTHVFHSSQNYEKYF